METKKIGRKLVLLENKKTKARQLGNYVKRGYQAITKDFEEEDGKTTLLVATTWWQPTWTQRWRLRMERQVKTYLTTSRLKLKEIDLLIGREDRTKEDTISTVQALMERKFSKQEDLLKITAYEKYKGNKHEHTKTWNIK